MNESKGIGQYDLEYMASPCAWGKEPAKFVQRIPHYITSGTVLDLGAGEGKNAIYLAKMGFKVTAVEISLYATRNFINWLIEDGKQFNNNIMLVQANVLEFKFSQQYDIIIAYGLLHSLPSKQDAQNIVYQMKTNTKPGGLNIICTFTDMVPMPEAQSYLEPIFFKPDELRDNLYSDWEILEYEHGKIKEKHPSNNIEHEHSLCRLITQKPQ
jgi:tellurite methyltransferase